AEATKDVKPSETTRPEAAVSRAQNGETPELDVSRSWTNDGLTAVLDQPAASAAPNPRPGPPAGLTPAMIMRLQAPSGNAAVAEWLQNQRPAQPAAALAPMASATTLAPPSKPEVAPAPRPE